MTTSKRLLLFDIDGTLLTSGGAGEHALKDSMQSQFNVKEDLQDICIAGSTDSAIARALLLKNHIPVTSENIALFLDGYLNHLPKRIPDHPGYLLPGILKLLNHLHTRQDCVLALLTGNLTCGAEIKLSHYGVWHFFEFGAFGDDHHNRNELGKFARIRAKEAHGIEFPPELIYVIGDTPKDVDCGKAIGARTVAIATGNYSMEELSQHQPDFLFKNLLDTEEVTRALFAE